MNKRKILLPSEEKEERKKVLVIPINGTKAKERCIYILKKAGCKEVNDELDYEMSEEDCKIFKDKLDNELDTVENYVDKIFEKYHLVDTIFNNRYNSFINNINTQGVNLNKNLKNINKLIDLIIGNIYKCIIVQDYNVRFTCKHLNRFIELEPLNKDDIVKSIKFYCLHLHLSKVLEEILKKRLKKFTETIDLEADIKLVESIGRSLWAVEKWFDKERFIDKFRTLKEFSAYRFSDNKELKMFDFWNFGAICKEKAFDTVHTYDGYYKLIIPWPLRDQLQAYYNDKPIECRDLVKPILEELFVPDSIGIDNFGEECGYNDLFKSFASKDINCSNDYDPDNVIKDLKSLIEFYKTELNCVKMQECKEWIIKNKENIINQNFEYKQKVNKLILKPNLTTKDVEKFIDETIRNLE